jgi:two-component system chemotaxis response regulator CheB
MSRHDIVVIGASTGSIGAIRKLVAVLPSDFEASIFIALHLPAGHRSLLPEILTGAGKLPTEIPEDQEAIMPGHIYIAPSDSHLLVLKDHMSLTRGPKENGFRPAIDALFRSAAIAYQNRVVGVILSGYLDDGTHGLLAIKHGGGIAIVQDPGEAEVPDMPQNALDYVHVDCCLPVSQIAEKLVSLVREDTDGASNAAGPQRKEDRNMEKETDIEEPPAPFVCPDCGGTLWQSREGEMVRFQCRVGHAFSQESMAHKHTEAVDRALWAALRSLEEHAHLLRRITQRPNSSPRFQEEAHEYEDHAALLREILTHPKEHFQQTPAR